MTQATVFIIALPLLAASCSRDTGRTFEGVLVCDFVDGPLIQKMTPQGKEANDAIVYQASATRTFTLNLKLSGGATVESEVVIATAWRDPLRPELIKTFHYISRARTLSEIHQVVKNTLARWGIQDQSLEEWFVTASHDPSSVVSFEAMRNDLRPSPSVAVIHSHDPDKPWALRLQLQW